jgi:hypothetical protein
MMEKIMIMALNTREWDKDDGTNDDDKGDNACHMLIIVIYNAASIYVVEWRY